MRRTVFVFVTGLALGLAAPAVNRAEAAWWESVQPEARVWLNKVDPQHRSHRSDDDRPWVSAEVHGVDPQVGAVTIHHGPLSQAGMPAMTMSLPVQDAVQVNMFKPGDRVLVQVADVGGVVRVINIKAQR